MKILLQKVKNASVLVNNKIVGKIDKGYCLFVGVHRNSTKEDAKYLAKKIVESRLFEDDNEKLNLSIKDVDGTILSISQFTLYAETKKGRRPSFSEAANSKEAKILYEKFNEYLEEYDIKVEKGIFQEYMEVSILNDGPVTVIFEKLSQN